MAEAFDYLRQWIKAHVSSMIKRILSLASNPQDTTGSQW